MTGPVTVKLKNLMKNHFAAQKKHKKWETPLEPNEAIELIRLLQDVFKSNEIIVPRHLKRSVPKCE